MKLPELSTALNAQFQHLVHVDSQRNQQTYLIEEYTVQVFVEMERKTIPEPTMKDPMFALGNCANKSCTDIARITITPPIVAVNQFVADYFNIKTSKSFGGPTRQFDVIEINGIKI